LVINGFTVAGRPVRGKIVSKLSFRHDAASRDFLNGLF
jgi:hypothetical protein